MTANKRRVLLGEITGAHGIKGDVVIRTYTTVPAAIAEYGPLEDATGQRQIRIRVRRVTEKGIVAGVDGIGDRNSAEALKGTQLYVARKALPETAEQEFYHADLVGLEARDAAGTPIGRVIGVVNYGAGDLIEISRHGQKETELVPFSTAFVPEIDIAAGRLVVLMPQEADEDEKESPDKTDR